MKLFRDVARASRYRCGHRTVNL